MFLTFFKLYKYYQIAKSVSYMYWFYLYMLEYQTWSLSSLLHLREEGIKLPYPSANFSKKIYHKNTSHVWVYYQRVATHLTCPNQIWSSQLSWSPNIDEKPEDTSFYWPLKSLVTIRMNEIFPCLACYGQKLIFLFGNRDKINTRSVREKAAKMKLEKIF